jgi:hypothetical protein
MSLTDDDKQWIENLLGSQLGGLEARLEERIISRVAKMIDTAIETAIETYDARQRERLEDLETKLLTAFHSWATVGGETTQPFGRD